MRGRFGRQWPRAAALLLGAALIPSQGWAAGFAVREQSAEGQGASFAGVAAGTNGPSSMYWNPATMSQHNDEGFVSESNIGLIFPYSRATDGVGAGPGVTGASSDSGNIGELSFAGSSYLTYGLTDQLTLGIAINTPFGLETKSDRWVGSLHGEQSQIESLDINPSVAFKINDMLTVGAGLQGEFMWVRLRSVQPSDLSCVPDLNHPDVTRVAIHGGNEVLDSPVYDTGVGFTLGALFEPTDGTSVGVGFRSSISHDLAGHGGAAIADAGPGDCPAKFKGHISADLETPEIATLGVRQRINDELTLLGGVEWTNWSRFKKLEIIRDDTGGVIGSTTENWQDSWFFSLGAEYALSDALKLRAGVAYEDSGVTDATRTPRVPDNDRYWLSIGASYQPLDWLTATLAYSHIFMDDGKVNLTVPSPLTATFKQHIDIVSAGVTINW